MGFHEDISNDSLSAMDAIKARAVFSDIYRFFDVAIAMKSDREELLDWIRQLYPRFRMEKAEHKVDATYYMMAETPREPLVIADENSHLKVKALNDIDSMPSYAYLLAFNYIAADLRSHFLLHSAVVARNDNGLAIVGSSGSGKTTLMLQLLLRRGFGFLSDDWLAINRTTHLIDPFPRSIGIRETTLSLFDSLDFGHLEPQVVIGGQRKWFVDISEISENGVEQPCRLKHVVFLVNSLSQTEKDEQLIDLTVDSINDELLEKLRPFARRGEIHGRLMRNCYALTLYPAAEAPSALEFERLCRSCGVWLLDVRRLSNIKPDFHATPEIRRIPWHTAAMELLKGLQNDFRSAPGQAFLELAGLLEGVECYRISIGELDEMADHVCDLVFNSEHEPSID